MNTCPPMHVNTTLSSRLEGNTVIPLPFQGLRLCTASWALQTSRPNCPSTLTPSHTGMMGDRLHTGPLQGSEDYLGRRRVLCAEVSRRPGHCHWSTCVLPADPAASWPECGTGSCPAPSSAAHRTSVECKLNILFYMTYPTQPLSAVNTYSSILRFL